MIQFWIGMEKDREKNWYFGELFLSDFAIKKDTKNRFEKSKKIAIKKHFYFAFSMLFLVLFKSGKCMFTDLETSYCKGFNI